MRRIASVILAIFTVMSSVAFTGCSDRLTEAWSRLGRETRAYLVVGLDDAAENTDVMALCIVDETRSVISVIQIPRDTYYTSSEYTGKLNGLYPSACYRGCDEREALRALSNAISSVLGVDVDGSVAVTVSLVAELVDSLGGIDVSVEKEMTLTRGDGSELLLRVGKNHLSGNDAMIFARHRSSYANADIGRLDAQKIVLSAIAAKIGSMDANTALGLYLRHDKDIVTDIKYSDICNFLVKKTGRSKSYHIEYATLPGLADMLNDGLSYYFISRNAAEMLLDEFQVAHSEIDAEQRLMCHEKVQIYYEKEIRPRVVTFEN